MLDPKLSGLEPAVALPSVARPSIVLGLIRACRPKQWSKNALLFFGLIFALKLTDAALVERALAGFLVFCAASSGVYLVNDIADLEQDRLHPKKRHRPLASGAISKSQATALAALLLVGAIAGGIALGMPFATLTIVYIVMTVVYSFRLKHVVLIDVFIIAAGFVIRAAAGAIVVSVPISPWLYVCTVLASLFLGFGKRRNELVLLSEGAGSHRPILEEYSLPLLDQLIVIVTAAAIMAYSLYTFSADNLPSDHSMMLTIPFVIYGFFRYLYLMHQRGGGGSPEDALLGDPPLLTTGVLWLLTAVVILYLSR